VLKSVERCELTAVSVGSDHDVAHQRPTNCQAQAYRWRRDPDYLHQYRPAACSHTDCLGCGGSSFHPCITPACRFLVEAHRVTCRDHATCHAFVPAVNVSSCPSEPAAIRRFLPYLRVCVAHRLRDRRGHTDCHAALPIASWLDSLWAYSLPLACAEGTGAPPPNLPFFFFLFSLPLFFPFFPFGVREIGPSRTGKREAISPKAQVEYEARAKAADISAATIGSGDAAPSEIGKNATVMLAVLMVDETVTPLARTAGCDGRAGTTDVPRQECRPG